MWCSFGERSCYILNGREPNRLRELHLTEIHKVGTTAAVSTDPLKIMKTHPFNVEQLIDPDDTLKNFVTTEMQSMTPAVSNKRYLKFL